MHYLGVVGFLDVGDGQNEFAFFFRFHADAIAGHQRLSVLGPASGSVLEII